MLKVLDLFSGIGGFSLGLERTGGFKTVAFCEIEPFCRQVLKKHWPDVPIFEDVRTLKGSDVGDIDVICGGFPCQDISLAGKGAGLAGDRSGLWSEIVRLVGEIRPEYVLVENVAALLGRGLGDVLGDLAALWYDAEWHCIPASHVGAPHRRDRIWIVAHPQRGEGRGPLHWGDFRVGRKQQSVPWNRTKESALAYARGMDDGISRAVDRTNALRNAIVPQIPEIIGRAILSADMARPPSRTESQPIHDQRAKA